MRYLFIALFLLAGCNNTYYVYPSVDVKAKELCANNGGVKYISIQVFHVGVLCNNNAFFADFIPIKSSRTGDEK